jgi:Rrf2 family protein
MAHFGKDVEYAIHTLLWLANPANGKPSSRELASFQGLPSAFIAKLLDKLNKAGLVAATEGVKGGYQLRRSANTITVLEIVDAIQGPKPLFRCDNIRGACALFSEEPPTWAMRGVCSVHAVLIRAEHTMRAELARTTVADLENALANKSPKSFPHEVAQWFGTAWAERIEIRRAPSSQKIKKKSFRSTGDN